MIHFYKNVDFKLNIRTKFFFVELWENFEIIHYTIYNQKVKKVASFVYCVTRNRSINQ